MKPHNHRKVSGNDVDNTRETDHPPVLSFPLPLAWDMDVMLVASLSHVDKDNTLRHGERTRQSLAVHTTSHCRILPSLDHLWTV